MPKRSRAPKVELIEYKQLKTAAGGSGASGGGSGGGIVGYKQGQNVRCKVLSKTDDAGYDVLILKDNLPAHLKSVTDLEDGDEILAVFVGVHSGRILLAKLFKDLRDKMSS
jgi:hypothetical protein